MWSLVRVRARIYLFVSAVNVADDGVMGHGLVTQEFECCHAVLDSEGHHVAS